jgi:transposase
MKGLDLYARVRRAVYVEGMSQRGAARYFGIDPRTVAKMMRFSVPPGYRRRRPPARPKLDPFSGIIDQILDDDASIPAKQRHTAKRIFERLRDEHGYGGGYTTVKDYVRVRRQHRREVFVPLWHPVGHGQADFGEAVAVIGGVAQKVHLFVMDLPHSDAGFVKAYPAETTEAFLDGHVIGKPAPRWLDDRAGEARAEVHLATADHLRRAEASGRFHILDVRKAFGA